MNETGQNEINTIINDVIFDVISWDSSELKALAEFITIHGLNRYEISEAISEELKNGYGMQDIDIMDVAYNHVLEKAAQEVGNVSNVNLHDYIYVIGSRELTKYDFGSSECEEILTDILKNLMKEDNDNFLEDKPHLMIVLKESYGDMAVIYSW